MGILRPENLRRVSETLLTKFLEVAPKVIIALILFYIFLRLVQLGITKVEREIIEHGAAKKQMTREDEKRIQTLFGIFRRISFFVVWGVGVLVIMALIGINVGPVLAAAGVLGLAISFGSQSLVKDLISGTFILFENQIRIGDVAIINGQGGLVEQINLRTVVLRDNSGVVHIFPNGSITTISNMTKEWSAMVFDIGVAYKEDIDHVISVIKKVADDLKADPVFGEKIIADIEIFGVDKFADSAVTVKARIKTKPIEQWNVGREYNKRLKKAFDLENIEFPFPHRTLYFGEASPAFEVMMRSNHVRKDDDKRRPRIELQDREIDFIEEQKKAYPERYGQTPPQDPKDV